MRVLVIGSGGREHALARSLASDTDVAQLHAAPGNPGYRRPRRTACRQRHRPGRGSGTRHQAGRRPGRRRSRGAAGGRGGDVVRAAGISCFGPSQDAAMIEGSKSSAKDVMTAAGVPTASARTCKSGADVAAALDEFGPPYVVKADGLAAGKGVALRPPTRTPPSGTPWPAALSLSRSFSTAPRSRCSRLRTAPPPCHCCPRRTTSGPTTTTKARIPAAWAPMRRCPGRRLTWQKRPSRRSWHRLWPSCAGAARRSAGCCTPGCA